MHFRCGGIFSNGIIAIFFLILTVKQFHKLIKLRLQKLGHPVYNTGTPFHTGQYQQWHRC